MRNWAILIFAVILASCLGCGQKEDVLNEAPTANQPVKPLDKPLPNKMKPTLGNEAQMGGGSSAAGG